MQIYYNFYKKLLHVNIELFTFVCNILEKLYFDEKTFTFIYTFRRHCWVFQ